MNWQCVKCGTIYPPDLTGQPPFMCEEPFCHGKEFAIDRNYSLGNSGAIEERNQINRRQRELSSAHSPHNLFGPHQSQA